MNTNLVDKIQLALLTVGAVLLGALISLTFVGCGDNGPIAPTATQHAQPLPTPTEQCNPLLPNYQADCPRITVPQCKTGICPVEIVGPVR
jgi:hypothetical protein